MIEAEALPPFRLALLAPGDRDNWYSASAAYSRVLAHDVLPGAQGLAFGVIGAPAGMGASLGALAMLHAQRRFPRAFGALFLQSGSFFVPRYDAHERRFSRYARITRFVRDTLRDGSYAMPVPVTITCGRAEENMANNREMASALASQGYDVDLEEVLDLHNYTGWRDAFDPHLTALLRRAWTAMNGTHHEFYSPAIGASGAVVSYGHYGRPVLAFPSEGGKAYDWQSNGMVDAIGGCSTPAGSSSTASTPSTPPRGRTSPPRSRSARRPTGATSRGSSTRSCRSSSTTRAARSSATGASLGAYPRRQLRPQARRPVPARHLHVRQLRPLDLERLGRARRRGVLQQPVRLRRAHGRRPPGLAALARQPAAGLRPGHVGGHDRRAAVDPGVRRVCWPSKGIRHELDLWGHDVPHDWPSWRAQIAHHLPRFC